MLRTRLTTPSSGPSQRSRPSRKKERGRKAQLLHLPPLVHVDEPNLERIACRKLSGEKDEDFQHRTVRGAGSPTAFRLSPAAASAPSIDRLPPVEAFQAPPTRLQTALRDPPTTLRGSGLVSTRRLLETRIAEAYPVGRRFVIGGSARRQPPCIGLDVERGDAPPQATLRVRCGLPAFLRTDDSGRGASQGGFGVQASAPASAAKAARNARAAWKDQQTAPVDAASSLWTRRTRNHPSA